MDVGVALKTDEVLREICVKLAKSGQSLRWAEQRRREMFSSPTDPAFIAAWRDFEERYQSVVMDVWLRPVIGRFLKGTEDRGATSPEVLDWEYADDSAKKSADGIEKAIDFAREEVVDEFREFPDGLTEEVLVGANAWDRLKYEVGFDPRGVFRRRELAPFVLVPRHVAAKHDSPDKADMYLNLIEAYDAFVYGAPRASVAMMRSILEAVLRDHYRAFGSDLSERINNARTLPPKADRKALHALRKLAIRILHLPEDEPVKPVDLEQPALEREVVAHLLVIRNLIEGVPARP